MWNNSCSYCLAGRRMITLEVLGQVKIDDKFNQSSIWDGAASEDLPISHPQGLSLASDSINNGDPFTQKNVHDRWNVRAKKEGVRMDDTWPPSRLDQIHKSDTTQFTSYPKSAPPMFTRSDAARDSATTLKDPPCPLPYSRSCVPTTHALDNILLEKYSMKIAFEGRWPGKMYRPYPAPEARIPLSHPPSSQTAQTLPAVETQQAEMTNQSLSITTFLIDCI